MESTQIIADIYQSSEITEVLSKVNPEHIRDDLRQHIFLELLEKPDAFIVDLNKRGKLKCFIVKMIYNTSRFTKSRFAKERGKEVMVDQLPDIIEEVEEEIVIPIDKIKEYDGGLLQLYAEFGTYQRVSTLTGIPVTSVFNTIKKAKRNIKRLI